MDDGWDDPDEPPEFCPPLEDGSCPVLLEEQEEPCDGCRWLKAKVVSAPGGTLTFNGPGDSLTINSDFIIPTPTRRQRWRWWLRELADRTLVPLCLMHYSGCWCEKCQNRFNVKLEKEGE